MAQMTTFECALLAQFERLAHASETSLNTSGATGRALEEFSARVGERMQEIEQRQSNLTAHLEDLATALTRQTQETKALVNAVNRLLAAQQG